MKIKFLALAILVFAPGYAFSDTFSSGPWKEFDGRSIAGEHPNEQACIDAINQKPASTTKRTYSCVFRHRRVVEALVEPPSEPPVAPPNDSSLLYQDLVRGPIGSPVTGWCSDGSNETVTIPSDTLCGEPLNFEITQGEIVLGMPPNIPAASDGDLVILSAGAYTSTVNCGGRTQAFCGDGNSGVSILGQGAVLANTVDCGVGDVDRLTFAGLEFATVGFSCSRGAGTKSNLRIVNNYVHDAATGQSGAFGAFVHTINLKVLGNRSNNTGIPGENNSHSFYHGGKGENKNVEFAYNRIENHSGGRCLQIYGHNAGETMVDLHIHHNYLNNCMGNAGILVSHTDGQRDITPPDNRSWIDSVVVENNTCGGQASGDRIQFRGANLNGGDDWIARNNDCPVNSTMGGDAGSWVIVTDNSGDVTGNTR